MMKGNIKNYSNVPIVIFGEGDYGFAGKVSSMGKTVMHWNKGCITVVENESMRFFDGREVPLKSIHTNLFSLSVNLEYESSRLYYIDYLKNRIELKSVENCANA